MARTKLASEALALEYGHTYNLPVIVNRCGVLAGEGQFGVAEQGIFSFWIRAYALPDPLNTLASTAPDTRYATRCTRTI